MPSLNRSVLVGRLTRDPEIRITRGGESVCTFTLAVDRHVKDKTTGERKADFIRCKAWKQKAVLIGERCRRGSLVCITGHIETSEREADDGTRQFFTHVIVDEVEFLDAPEMVAPSGPRPSAYPDDDEFGGR